jgi:hypothetical protein
MAAVEANMRSRSETAIMDQGPTALIPSTSAPDGPVPPKFSEELRELTRRFHDQPVRLATLLEATQGRGIHLLLVLIALPFVTPVPLPGLSIPFGLVVFLLGARLALGLKPWLPRRLLGRELPSHFLPKLLSAAGRVVRLLEFFLRPRLRFVRDHEAFGRAAGVLIAVSGLLLVLPLPLPFSNSLPAWTVLFLAAGALGRDGLFFIAGCVAFGVSAVFFTLLALGGMETLEKLRRLVLGD